MASTRTNTILALAAGLVLGTTGAHAESVDWQLRNQWQAPAAPLDITVTPDGKRTLLLLEGGRVQFLDPLGRVEHTLDLGVKADRMALDPGGTLLYLSDRASSTVRLVELEFVQEFDLGGAPARGPADAPVAVVVFSDFQ